MSTKMRRNFVGTCTASHANNGDWRIVYRAPHDAEIIIRGADARAAGVFGAPLSNIGIEWQEQRVLLTLLSGNRVATVEAVNVIVHEPARKLYAALPLADFDSRARRFWRRVFLIVRIPGGRSILGILARTGRRRA